MKSYALFALSLATAALVACGASEDKTASGEGELKQGTVCGGFAGIECPKGLVCVDDPNDGCDTAHGGADCGGICQASPTPGGECGGFGGIECPKGLVCVDAPNDGCDPAHGGADCGGICQAPPTPGATCGGVGAFACPKGLTCVFDLAECDPAKGGRDCSGICK